MDREHELLKRRERISGAAAFAFAAILSVVALAAVYKAWTPLALLDVAAGNGPVILVVGLLTMVALAGVRTATRK